MGDGKSGHKPKHNRHDLNIAASANRSPRLIIGVPLACSRQIGKIGKVIMTWTDLINGDTDQRLSPAKGLNVVSG